jgi:hypothetical protein
LGRVTSDLGIRPLVNTGQTYFDVVSDGHDSRNTLCIGFRMVLLHEAAHKPRQCDNTVVDGHRNVGGIDVRIPPEFALNIASDVAVGPHARYSISDSRLERSTSQFAVLTIANAPRDHDGYQH